MNDKETAGENSPSLEHPTIEDVLDELKIPMEVRHDVVLEIARGSLELAAIKKPEAFADHTRVIDLPYVGSRTVGELLGDQN